MRITVRGETHLVVDRGRGALEIEEEGGHFGPLHMLAGSLGTCILAVLESWSRAAGLDAEGMEVGVRWGYEEDPYRVGSYRVEIRWPDLPEERLGRVRRVAESCTVHHTLHHPPEVTLEVAG